MGSEKSARIVDRRAPDAPLYFIAMEPRECGSLWDRLGVRLAVPRGEIPVLNGVRLPPEAALRAAADLTAGLAALHKLGYAHADLK